MTQTFEKKHNIAEIAGIDTDYTVDWVGPDLAYLSVDGEVIVEFASFRDGGFLDEADVIEQAQDVVSEIDTENLLQEWFEEDDDDFDTL